MVQTCVADLDTILFRVEDAECGLAAEVHAARAGCYSVSLVDLDAGERVQVWWFFPTLEAAQDKARRMMAGKP